MTNVTLRFDDLVDGMITNATLSSIDVRLKDGRCVEISVGIDYDDEGNSENVLDMTLVSCNEDS